MRWMWRASLAMAKESALPCRIHPTAEAPALGSLAATSHESASASAVRKLRRYTTTCLSHRQASCRPDVSHWSALMAPAMGCRAERASIRESPSALENITTISPHAAALDIAASKHAPVILKIISEIMQ